ncbi:cytochrome P450 [Piscinibacter sp.]|uniref:cytochrome P450 n=1 Tax=Piscinibacter sp. TaxID=1903157 RepID=UPI002C2DB5C3|nr:cytochrome P450 [Albitalea sp.]HUG21490.1 cytochrome P450 [Albitalea sp.]
METQVSNGLNLFLRLQDSTRLTELLLVIQQSKERINLALQGLHYVHFARFVPFVPAPDQAYLLVITEFDGDLKPYVMDFAAVIGDEFSAILGFVADPPPLPVQNHPEAFWSFIEANNRADIPVWSAYPDKTVLDIVGPRRAPPPTPDDPPPAQIDLADVQGNILRGYRARHALHFALAIDDGDGARRFLAALTDGDSAKTPRVSSATVESESPAYLLNIGFTHWGLNTLGVPADALQRFPQAFREGPADTQRAWKNGDFEASDPLHWRLGGPGTPAVDLLVSLYTRDAAELEVRRDQLDALRANCGLRTVSVHRTDALPNGKVHFDYRDSIGQPHVAGAPPRSMGPDMQPAAQAGEFLLGRGYVNQYGGNFIGMLPPALADNGTYAAVRMLEQDVRAFHGLLEDAGRRHDVQPDMVAAKLMGRWQNGRALSVSPVNDGGPVTDKQLPRLNHFDFAPTTRRPDVFDDADGARCPVGSHIRRLNPRSALATGKPHSRRIIRRGMAYGPAYDPKNPADTEERGLFGLFICGDLEAQFEFLMQFWVNGDLSAHGLRGTQDPILGTQKMGGRFSFQVDGRTEPLTVQVPRLISTRGSLYMFMPGIGGLRHLANLPAPTPPRGRSMPNTVAPDAFDPHDPHFIADPYPQYARFRAQAPVHRVRAEDSYWVFTHALVSDVLQRKDEFLKNPVPVPPANNVTDVVHHLPNGLFFADPPRHGQMREMLDPLFAQAIESAAAVAQPMASQLVEAIRAKGSLELIADYAIKLPLGVFMHVFGVRDADGPGLAAWINSTLAGNNDALPAPLRFQGFTARMAVGSYFQALRAGCPMGQRTMLSLMKTVAEHTPPYPMSPEEVQQTAVHFALGGYLSTTFLIATGVFNLLRNPDQLATLRSDPTLLGRAIHEMLRYDAPFQLTDRYAANDTTLGKMHLPRGSKVTMVFASANRDETVFPDPDRFDIGREPGPHFSFGGEAIHKCIGKPLVDIVAPIAFRTLLDGLPNLRLAAAPPIWQHDPYFRSFTSFPLLK